MSEKKKITDFFNRPVRAKVNHGKSAEEMRSSETPFISSPPSSALTEPTSSFLRDIAPDNEAVDTSISGKAKKARSSPKYPTPQVIIPLSSEPDPEPDSEPKPKTEPAPSSFMSDSLSSSQRIIKDGKEIVVDSDGMESDDSSSDFEDPSLFFAFKSADNPTKPVAPAVRLPQKKYKNTMDSLVHEAVDAQEQAGIVAKSRAALLTAKLDKQEAGQPRESMLASAMTFEDDTEGPDMRRILDAVRRTEALDHSKQWRFLENTHIIVEAPEFPAHLFPPRSRLAALQDTESRHRMLQSGILEYAAKLQRLPDEFLLWLFESVSHEPREESRKAFCRIFAQTSKERVATLIRPSHVDNLFKNLGAKLQALDLSHIIVECPEHLSHSSMENKRLKPLLLSVCTMLRESAELYATDTRAHAVLILLRIAIDSTLTVDMAIRSELQSCLTALLENVSGTDTTEMDRLICNPVFETVPQPEFLASMLEHILPTSSWISLLRYRLAVAFLLRSPTPITESPEVVVDLKRLTQFLVSDERFHAKSHQTNDKYDYGELIGIALLLEISFNSMSYDLTSQQPDAEEEFNKAVDKFAAQIKIIFSSIKDTGASHLKRMMAKGALENIHYRAVYSIRTKPIARKTYFQDFGKQNGNIKSMFQKSENLVIRSPSKPKPEPGFWQ